MSVPWHDAAAEPARRRLFEAAPLLIALDFDGTLAPLCDEPMQARATPAAAAAVAALTRAPDTVVAYVSGRSLSDLREIAEHTDDSPVLLAGSHGAEFWIPGEGALQTSDDDEQHRLRDELRARAEALAEPLSGVWIEPKAFGFGVHTRLASESDTDLVRAGTDALVAENAPHWRRRSGHNIVEYAFRTEGKDSAVAALRERVGARVVMFAGDDVTDEDAMRSLHEGDVGVRVGGGESAALLSASDPDDLAAFLSDVAQNRGARRE